MSVSLTKYPVVTSSGRVLNIFPGFSDVNLEFKREDIQIISVGSGVDSQIAITVLGDLTSSLNVGESIYLYAEGSTYTYDLTGKIVSVVYGAPNTVITISENYIENATTGYINYKQNWYLEYKLVNVDNNNIFQYPKLLRNDGSPAGIVEANVSMLVDFLENSIENTSQEITGARDKCKVMYREVWREDDTAVFTLVDQEPIIIIFAADEIEAEQFINGFEYPKMWKGYPFWINLAHSIENLSALRLAVDFDELDINKDDITTNNPLANFQPTDFGILQSNFNDNENTIDSLTKYIRFNIQTSDLPDYETGDYDDTDYLTINTP